VNRLQAGVWGVRRAERSEQTSQTANTAWIWRWQSGLEMDCEVSEKLYKGIWTQTMEHS